MYNVHCVQSRTSWPSSETYIVSQESVEIEIEIEIFLLPLVV